MMARFVRDYLGLLDERVTAITGQLEAGNDLTAHISLLSLESTSSMVGAKELAKIAGLLRGAVERGQHALGRRQVRLPDVEVVDVQPALLRVTGQGDQTADRGGGQGHPSVRWLHLQARRDGNHAPPFRPKPGARTERGAFADAGYYHAGAGAGYLSPGRFGPAPWPGAVLSSDGRVPF